jgi:arylsulfatase
VHLVQIHNFLALDQFTVTSTEPIQNGEVTIRHQFLPTGAPAVNASWGTPSRNQLYINDRLIGVPLMQLNAVIGMAIGFSI